MQEIRYWGHKYTDTPIMVSDAFAYGNYESMKRYCQTYDWILENDILLKGLYTQGPEVYLTDNVLQHVFYNVPGGEHEPTMSKENIIQIYNRNIRTIECKCNYTMIARHIRTKNNINITLDNVWNYTKQIKENMEKK